MLPFCKALSYRLKKIFSFNNGTCEFKHYFSHRKISSQKTIIVFDFVFLLKLNYQNKSNKITLANFSFAAQHLIYKIGLYNVDSCIYSFNKY